MLIPTKERTVGDYSPLLNKKSFSVAYSCLHEAHTIC